MCIGGKRFYLQFHQRHESFCPKPKRWRRYLLSRERESRQCKNSPHQISARRTIRHLSAEKLDKENRFAYSTFSLRHRRIFPSCRRLLRLCCQTGNFRLRASNRSARKSSRALPTRLRLPKSSRNARHFRKYGSRLVARVQKREVPGSACTSHLFTRRGGKDICVGARRRCKGRNSSSVRNAETIGSLDCRAIAQGSQCTRVIQQTFFPFF